MRSNKNQTLAISSASFSRIFESSSWLICLTSPVLVSIVVILTAPYYVIEYFLKKKQDSFVRIMVIRTERLELPHARLPWQYPPDTDFFQKPIGEGYIDFTAVQGTKNEKLLRKIFLSTPPLSDFCHFGKVDIPLPNRFSKKIGVRGWCHGNRACAGGSRQFRMIKNSQKHVIDPCLIGPVQVQINRLAFLVFYNRPVLGKNSNKHSKVTNGPGSSRFTLVINMTHNL